MFTNRIENLKAVFLLGAISLVLSGVAFSSENQNSSFTVSIQPKTDLESGLDDKDVSLENLNRICGIVDGTDLFTRDIIRKASGADRELAMGKVFDVVFGVGYKDVLEIDSVSTTLITLVNVNEKLYRSLKKSLEKVASVDKLTQSEVLPPPVRE